MATSSTPPRNYAMDIATAFAKADAQTLAEIGYELLASLGEARGVLASFEAQKARDRGYDRERKRRVRRNPAESTGNGGPSPFSPTPPFNPTTSTTSSSPPREVWRPVAEQRIAEKLPTDAGRQALAAVLHVGQGVAGKTGICSLIEFMLAGERGEPRPTPEQLDRALCDYATNGMSEGEKFNANHFRACVRTAMKPPKPDNGRRGGPGQSVYDKIQEAL